MVVLHFLIAADDGSDAGRGLLSGQDGGLGDGAASDELPSVIFSAPLGHPSSALAAESNENPFLLDRLRGCDAQHGRKPNFVAVDFYESGDLIETCQKLSGLIP